MSTETTDHQVPGVDETPVVVLETDPVELISPRSVQFDIAMAVVLCLATCGWGDIFATGYRHPDFLASVVTSVAMVLPLALRRVNPMLMIAMMGLAGIGQVILLRSPTWSVVAIPIACYSVARWVDGRESRWVVMLGGMGSVLGPLRWTNTAPTQLMPLDYVVIPNIGPLVALCLGWVVIPYLMGRRDRDTMKARQERERAAAERHAAEITRAEQQAKMASSRVRTEIARELHDVVAHSLSVIIVQANGGKALARKRPEAATEVLETIAATGTEALGEMRRILGVLRDGPEAASSADYQPAPGLGEIAAMVERTGERVHLSVSGPQPDVSAAVGVTAFRIVQEAITNFLKHAGDQAQATVTITYRPNTIDIRVTDDGAGTTSGDLGSKLTKHKGSGYGLLGMTERVTAMGGRMTAAPGEDGGWTVHAVLPIDGRKVSDKE
ncbi:hypothetical protein HMPREF1531_00947 [Propionibacterium sp. oral taxon 192 str. F0372]|uniref:sensor histidine kinase n=1 Tax=Propionibacterium sp. oral taxon 192 TaxID=671222 RepID=UPI0003542155|nr:histidine kinase [Propionibacterium sp. oral taxon 192]EPH05518.1 hypothetical protein HMPREF1531_00947 [Propionibacterium sp. oral taxon 192 str. F0372]